MLQRAANNAYSWWWASHIRTKQSKWLDSNLQGQSLDPPLPLTTSSLLRDVIVSTLVLIFLEMEGVVKRMLKLIDTDADSFAKRAELYFKRRPELINFVEDAYRAYRALAERYDHIAGELHKANHTIATAFPEQVQYAMLEEEEDSLPKAITPIDPSKINKPTVEGLMNKRRENESSIRRKQKKGNAPQFNNEQAQEEINKLQKGILVLQTEKEFIKSSYESGIVKYWEIEKQIVEMQEKACSLQDEFSTSAVIGDNEAHALMTETALKSCEDAIVNLQEQRKKSLEQAKVESERIKIASKKLKIFKGEYCQSEMVNADMSGENTQMGFAAEKMEEDDYALNKARLELQSICEKIRTHFEMNTEGSVSEMAEKINELVNKVITLELTVSSQAVQINQLASENNELDECLLKLEEEKNVLINDSNALSKRLKEAEEELSRVQAIEKIVQDEEIVFHENLAAACCIIKGFSDKLQSHEHPEDDCIVEKEVSKSSTEPQRECQDKKVNEIHEMKKGLEEEIHTTQELGHFLKDLSQTEADSGLKSASGRNEDLIKRNELAKKVSSQADLSICLNNNEQILPDGEEQTLKFQQIILSGLEGREKILLAEYTSLLQNYKETKRRLSEEVLNKNQYLQRTMALTGELKNSIAIKDEEIRLLRQQLASLKMSSSVMLDAPSVEGFWLGQHKLEGISNSPMVTENPTPRDPEMPKDLNASATKQDSCVEFTEITSPLAQGTNANRIDEPTSISPNGEKFRRDIDALLDGNLEFWLRFSTSFHFIQDFRAKFKDLQADISKPKENKTLEGNGGAAIDRAGPESALLTTRLRELKTELQVWLEQSTLLRAELHGRISSLCYMQEKISGAVNTELEPGEVLLTPCQAAGFHGEVMNMKQENNKAASELQMGIDYIRRLQLEIEQQLSELREPFIPKSSPTDHLENSPNRTNVPLRVFLFGAKPKKPSLFARIQPMFQRQTSKLRAGHRSKRFSQPE
ncbi:hypothetical protein C4D60_Mb07t14040 [Musa balbisiana]|uniref:NAB domain-containing protein n=1 Tax=Musa balbisiana TaxID=52838 RepID=A0A4S8JF64_MUSBA|nr:hypothetical protein C4D60_Mb07t14040 [Musa balbisiana]